MKGYDVQDQKVYYYMELRLKASNEEISDTFLRATVPSHTG